MEIYRDVKIEKSKLVDELRGILYNGIEGMTPEKFESYSSHIIYKRFATDFASKLEQYAEKELSPEDYVKVFIKTMKEELKNAGREGFMNYGQLAKAHDYFDSLVETVAKRANGNNLGDSYAEDAKRIFSHSKDFFDLYDEVKSEVA